MKTALDGLHDFYQPPPPSWRPQTMGWYIVFAVAALLLLWFVLHMVRVWRRNRYRRESLVKVAQVDAMQLSVLLKRTALSAWPREEVASLSGEAWLKFLDSAVDAPLFNGAPADRLEEIALTGKQLSSSDELALRDAARTWIKQHRPRRSKGLHESA